MKTKDIIEELKRIKGKLPSDILNNIICQIEFEGDEVSIGTFAIICLQQGYEEGWNNARYHYCNK